MFKNYLKIAWRNIWKSKGYSALNIFGLVTGITCASLIFLWVENEVDYDRTFEKRDQIYTVLTNSKFEGEWRTFGDTPGPLAQDLKEEVPGILSAARASNGNMLFKVGANIVKRTGSYVDDDFLDIFSLHFVEGTPQGALKRPDGIILTVQTARDLFGENKLVLNKTVQVNNNSYYTITGVVEDWPENTSINFNWLAPFERFNEGEDNGWMEHYGNNFANTYIELASGSDYTEVNTKVRGLLPEKLEDPDSYFFLHPVKDWHLRSNFENGVKVGGQIVFVRLMAGIAGIILLIACINFTNLATARSEKRAKEVGLRKVLGSGKQRLISQFMAEALLMSGMAAVVSIFVLSILLPEFNLLIEKQLQLRFFDLTHSLSFLGITLTCGLMAGWYPAFYLSSFRPAEVLKGLNTKQGGSGMIRKGLVVAQFVVSVVFIISTIIAYQQIQYGKNRDVGFVKEHLVKIPVSGDMIKNFNPIKGDMIASGVIKNVALMNTQLLSDGYNGTNLEWQGATDTKDVLISFRHISADFFKTAGMKIIEGRGFGEDTSVDSTNTIISQSFSKLMGKGSAIGKTINRYGVRYTVIGVVKDYLYGDMYGNSDPVMFFNDPSWAQYMYVKTLKGTKTSETLTVIEKVLKAHNPAFPFEYEFVNDSFSSRFKGENMVSNFSQIFALLAIIISCLGLFGLSAYTAEQRKKEIGVRKVLGCSISGIVKLLSRDFIRLVLIAILLAIPLAWWVMKNWLEGFTYRIEISWWVFAVAGLTAICIALLTVSFQALKAAIANPVKNLRME